ncbi:MAG: glycosyltransferase [Nitratireductor sp.]|nr:glycosyltransferase [Nitratireductor sp.]
MSGGITFVDPLAPRAYSGAPGQMNGLGGTEATLVRICEALGDQGNIVVRQSARAGRQEHIGGVAYEGFDIKRPLPEDPATIVVVNSWKVATKLARQHPDARVHVWLHVFPGRHNRALATDLVAAGVEVVCVSATHAQWLGRFLGADAPVIRHIHNPIDDHLTPDNTPRDPNFLFFASSPHKGLAQVFERFETLRQRLPGLKLAVADPGYLVWPTGRVPKGVFLLGHLEHARLIQCMRRALCLFYPQDQFAETFGLVIAEANAVGCPALLERGLGANDEIASDPDQCIDTSDPDAIAARILKWQAADPAEPLARARAEFRLSSVVNRWASLLELSSAPTSKSQTKISERIAI